MIALLAGSLSSAWQHQNAYQLNLLPSSSRKINLELTGRDGSIHWRDRSKMNSNSPFPTCRRRPCQICRRKCPRSFQNRTLRLFPFGFRQIIDQHVRRGRRVHVDQKLGLTVGVPAMKCLVGVKSMSPRNNTRSTPPCKQTSAARFVEVATKIARRGRLGNPRI